MDFKAEVIDKSFEHPVVVDFWAEWCGPCRTLGPIIEELANEAEGKWTLVKLNTEEEQELAQEFGIRGIPAVKMISKGDVIAEFTGALPKFQIQNWLDENLPTEASNELDDILVNGSLDVLKAFTQDNPTSTKARFELAFRLLKSSPQEAEALFQSCESDLKFFEKAKEAQALVELMLCNAENLDVESVHPKVLESIEASKKAFVVDDFEVMLEHLIKSIMYSKDFCNQLARRICIAIFHFLGENHQTSLKYRKRFNMALY